MSVFWTEDEWHPNTRTTYICTQYLSNSSVLFLMPVDNISYKTHFSVVWHEAQSTDDIIKSRVSFHHSCLKVVSQTIVVRNSNSCLWLKCYFQVYSFEQFAITIFFGNKYISSILINIDLRIELQLPPFTCIRNTTKTFGLSSPIDPKSFVKTILHGEYIDLVEFNKF